MYLLFTKTSSVVACNPTLQIYHIDDGLHDTDEEGCTIWFNRWIPMYENCDDTAFWLTFTYKGRLYYVIDGGASVSTECTHADKFTAVNGILTTHTFAINEPILLTDFL